MASETRTARNIVLWIVLLFAAYLCCFRLLPRSLGGGLPPSSSPTFLNMAYNGLFFPLRWATERKTRSYNVTVGDIDLPSRSVRLMISPKLGYSYRFRGRDETAIRELKPGDRIRVTVEYQPHFLHPSSYPEFRSYARLSSDAPETPRSRTSSPVPPPL
jgi:hypothetical protein